MMNKLEMWLSKWRLKPNPRKSQYIIFHHKISQNSPSITIKGIAKKPTAEIKYLGVEVDNKMNFNKYTKAIKKRTISRAKTFTKLTVRNRGINTNNAVKIYKTICRPVLEYAHPIFANCRRPALNNLKTAETTSLRTITKIRHPENRIHNPPNELLYQITNIQPIEERLKKLNKNFYALLKDSQDILDLFHHEHIAQAARKYPPKSLILTLEEQERN
ncbi:hypothetical protein HHI36_000426 [Cryptolaemus montrouzieri]|uniref:RNA-directed DNA polymerase from mobile element jockey n=1 Tax=Cryptolaemus montrouzieri TaxID=559131 RepID=A0ABD2P5C7_9CUCU